MLGEINIEVLKDGVVKLDTNKIPAAIHDDADKLYKEFVELMGGDVTTTQKHARPRHSHHHDHVHTHEHNHDH